MDIEHLAATEAFRNLDSEALEALLAHGTVRDLPPGDALFRQGDPDRNRLYILYSGRVALSDETGRVSRDSAVALLGLSSYFDDEPYALTATAETACRIIEVPLDTVRTLEQAYPALADALSHVIADRIRAGSQARTPSEGALAQPVRTYMNAPLTTCTTDTTLREAFERMDRGGMGSLGVLDEAGGLVGLATVRSIARAIALDGEDRDASVVTAAQPVVSVAPDASLYDAQELQSRHGVKYIAVMEGTRPVGILSQTNILHAMLTQQASLRERVRRADRVADLRAMNRDTVAIARDAWQSNREASRAAQALSEHHLLLQQRCVELVEQELKDEGLGEAPRPWALLVLGSLGRREALLTPDQDNAIVFDDTPANGTQPAPLSEAEATWFDTFSERVNLRLDEIGYEWCKGDIMARNPDYRGTLQQWSERIEWLCRHPNETGARWGNIFFDFARLAGDDRLVSRLWDATHDHLARRPRLLRFMTADDAEGTPAVGLFNRLITSDREEGRGRIDLKRNGLRILCNGTRIFALSAGIRETNTVSRLRALQRQGVMTAEMVDSVLAAHEELTDLLMTHQIEQAEAGHTPDKYIDPERLDTLSYQALVTSLRAVRRLQDQLQGRFGL